MRHVITPGENGRRQDEYCVEAEITRLFERVGPDR